ncbi:MAG: FAD-dependent oxidoreductase [Hyphomicrobiaceae bacterium]|nr:FAD-dependent oxidoreductase [Hyphomicrobiaceae bacterium]
MTDKKLPTQARVVVVGGGIAGCSVAYHLTKLGWKDVVLLEQGRLSGGTTWHAAGLVGQLRNHENLTRLIEYSTRLYADLEAETGQATGWKACGSLSIARTKERMTVLKRVAAKARAYGVEAEVISAKEASEKWPVMETKDLEGAVWLPGDGKANPADLTQALSKGARQNGAQIFEKVRVTGVELERGAVRKVATTAGDIACEYVVNAGGQWARQFGRLAGVNVPLYSCEHFYIVTGLIDGVSPDLPCLRDPDGYIYFKEEVGGLVMGGFEPDAKPWSQNPIPDDFEFTLLEDDWDQFEILMENALIRVPQLETAEIKQFINGPESFTSDGYFILGEAPEVKNYFVCAGFNSMGIASAGGAGKALAEWMVEGEPTSDVWPVDIRRFGAHHGNDAWLEERVKETLGLHYVMPWPNKELVSGRPLRCSPVYEQLKVKGACFGTRMGWERPLWYARDGQAPEMDYSFGRQNWFDQSAAEHNAVREGVGLFDLSSFGKLLVQGRDAEAELQRLCANNIAVESGCCVYTGMLNARGGYESDLTVTRLSQDRFMLVTGSAQINRDLDWITRNLRADAHVTVTDITNSLAVFAVMGPKARDLLSRLTPDDLGNGAFPFATSQTISLGQEEVRANRLTYVGELGWELYVPIETASNVYEQIVAAGDEFGLVHAGYYALESLRVEKAYRSWGHELTPDYSPFEAGLGFAVDFGKGDFIGRDALLELKKETPKRRLALFVVQNSEAVLWGGELILRDGEPVGEIESAAYGHTLGGAVGLGYVNNEGGVDRAFIESGAFEIDIAGDLFPAKAHLRTPYDPRLERVKA